ncbi:MAG: SIMPL domain-containing protein [Halopenitus sp.]
MDRRLSGVLAVVVLVLLAGCGGVAVTDGTDTTDERADADNVTAASDRTIEVMANGEATADPDRATIRLSVRATGSDPGAVREELAKEDETLLAALRDWGLSDDQIRTVRYDVRQDRESRKQEETKKYVGIHTYAVEIHKVDAVGEVIDVAIGNGADQIDRVQFGLSEERAAKVRERALKDAMASAKSDATVIADSAGLEIVGVQSVSTAETRTIHAEYASPAQAGGDAATSVEPGDVSVEVRVRVVYGAEATES